MDIFKPVRPNAPNVEQRGGLMAILPPDGCARVVKAEGKIAKRMADLQILKNILEGCEKALKDIDRIPAENKIVKEFCVFGAATRFFSCFSRSDTTMVLTPKKIFANFPNNEILFQNFKWWEAHRNNMIAHSQSVLDNAIVGVIIGPEHTAVDVQTFSFTTNFVTDAAVKVLHDLVGAAYIWADAAYKDCDTRLRKEFADATPEALAAMEDALMHIPHTTNAHEVLRRY